MIRQFLCSRSCVTILSLSYTPQMPPFTFPAETTDTMGIMKKAWVYKRKNIKGWWVGWYEGGKKRAKALPSKALAKHFCQIKYTQLN